MKCILSRILLVIAAVSSPAIAHGRTFDCSVPGDRFGFLILDFEADSFALRYGRFDEPILQIRRPTNLLQELPGGRLIFDSGRGAAFPIGDSSAHAYGHIDEDGSALIDLYEFGVGKDLSVTLIDSTCTELETEQ